MATKIPDYASQWARKGGWPASRRKGHWFISNRDHSSFFSWRALCGELANTIIDELPATNGRCQDCIRLLHEENQTPARQTSATVLE